MFLCHDFLGYTQSRICPKLGHRHAKCWLESYICFLLRLISSLWFRIIFAYRMTSSNLSKLIGSPNANLIKLSHQSLFPKHDILKGRWDREISRHFWYRYRYSPIYYWASWQWLRGIEPFSTSLTLGERDPQVCGGFSSQKRVRRSLDVALMSLWPRCWASRWIVGDLICYGAAVWLICNRRCSNEKYSNGLLSI